MSQANLTRRYFDNAATSFPKPPGVLDAVKDYFVNVGASAGRGTYREADTSRRILNSCRAALRKLFGCRPEDQIIFTLNGTDSLNLAIKGTVQPGDHVVTTVTDHNSVLRPLSALQQTVGVTWTAVRADPRTTRLNPDDVRAAIRPNTALVVINHASNVTGVLQPIEPIATLCRDRRIPLLLDAAQSAGHVPIHFARLPVDLLACPGHKGLLGPLGTGVLVVRAALVDQLRTLREGGTGSESEYPVQPAFAPDKFEAGSHNAPGIAGLLAATRWILERGVADLRHHELALCAQFIGGLVRLPNLRWFGPRDPEQRVGVFSVRIEGWEPAALSAVLEEHFGVLTRSGLHCAPLAHETIGTSRDGGTTRFSLGPFLGENDVEQAVAALHEFAAAPAPSAIR
jgi:cysteine desulfurase/selenocysteine lyase